jgi:3-methylcrotonyl-CoA carboxylase alpha subunit
VARVLVRPGDKVAKNAPLLVVEAMKTEFTLQAPADGTVDSVRHQVDDMVEEGTELVTFKTEAPG